MPELVLATYNIHACIGRDRRFAPVRIRDVLREVDADLVALQEVESHASGFDMLAWLARETSMHAVAGPNLARGRGDYGNAVLSHAPFASVERIDLSVPALEPRGALDVEIRIDGVPLRVLVTHLGLRPGERREQIRRLLAALGKRSERTTVLMGDLNEWFLWGRPVRWLRRFFDTAPAPLTFPSGWPLFALDRIWVHPRSALAGLHVHRTALAGIASDHLPVVARIDLPAAA